MRASTALALSALVLSCRPPAAPQQIPHGIGGAGGTGVPCDQDGDGWDGPSCEGPDCDDGDAEVYLGASERCGDGKDDDCDGEVDEGCACAPGDMRACWTGEPSARDVGACRDGAQRCGTDGAWTACAGERPPQAEAPGCDGIDDDCDGRADPDPACDACPGGGEEICGNGLDDDCSGEIDDASLCTLDCDEVNPRDPAAAALSCCGTWPPVLHAFVCSEGGGLAACASEERRCLDLDGDPGTPCAKSCEGEVCRCGSPRPGDTPTPSAGCGFLTPCARVDCGGRQRQPCYDGPPGTLGVGICHGGLHSCTDAGGERRWNGCEGEQLPMQEICGNGLDDDCDGVIDEEEGEPARSCVRRGCDPGAFELCGNGVDDDCDGFADEGCPAPVGATQVCWTGALLERGTGACTDGVQREQEGSWGPCTGEVHAAAERCGDGDDSDCNGLGGPGQPEDPSCCVPEPEVCNGVDDDCDGLVDEGLVSHCGSCNGPCYTQAFDELACPAEGRTCERVAPHAPDGDALTRVEGPPPEAAEVLHVASLTDTSPSLLDRVYQIDTRTGLVAREILPELPQAPETLSTSLDGSLWVFLGFDNDNVPAEIQHLARDGSLICRLRQGDVFPGQEEFDLAGHIAADPGGDAWVSGYNPRLGARGYSLRRLSGTEVVPVQESGAPWPDGVPRCRTLDLDPGDPNRTDISTFARGFVVVDPNHRVWVPPTNSGRETGFDILDPLTGWQGWYPTPPIGYGRLEMPVIGPDESLYDSNSGRLLRLDASRALAGEPGAVTAHLVDLGDPFDLSSDGTAWLLGETEANVVEVDPQTGAELGRFAVPGEVAGRGALAVDLQQRVWVAKSAPGTMEIWRFDPHDESWLHVLDGVILRLDPRSTNRALRDVLARRGLWTQIVDPGSHQVDWHDLRFDSRTTRLGRVFAEVRFADSIAELPASTRVCGPFESSPGDLSRCSGGRRFARIEIHITGSQTPLVKDVAISWHRP